MKLYKQLQVQPEQVACLADRWYSWCRRRKALDGQLSTALARLEVQPCLLVSPPVLAPLGSLEIFSLHYSTLLQAAWQNCACLSAWVRLDFCWYPMHVVQEALPSATTAPSPLMHVIDTLCAEDLGGSSSMAALVVSPRGNLPEPSSCMHSQAATGAQQPECVGAEAHDNVSSCINIATSHVRSTCYNLASRCGLEQGSTQGCGPSSRCYHTALHRAIQRELCSSVLHYTLLSWRCLLYTSDAADE